MRENLLDRGFLPVVVHLGRRMLGHDQVPPRVPPPFWFLAMSGAAQPASAERSRQAQLRALEAQFYEQFSMPGVKAPQDEEDDEEEEGEEEEEDDDEDNLDDLDDLEDEGENASDLDDDEDLLLSAKAKQPTIPAIPARRVPETVVFTDPSSSRPSAPMSKQARKQFMVRAPTNIVLGYRANWQRAAGHSACDAQWQRVRRR